MESCPVYDMHCDLLYYLSDTENANPNNKEDIGCAIPYLIDGNVKLQIMAAYSEVQKGSSGKMLMQVELFEKLAEQHSQKFFLIKNTEDLQKTIDLNKIGILFSIENASGLCEEDEPVEKTRARLNTIKRKLGQIIYISITHHGENRFGGGNNTSIGLKDDGKSFLEFLDSKKIAIDISHASDALALDVFYFIDKHRLDIPVIASHSNFRTVFEHARNLPDELVQEIVLRKGLIGMNFLRAYIHPTKPEELIEHILYGFDKGAGKTLCFGADYFFTKDSPDKSRIPFYFAEHENAGKYPEILHYLKENIKEERTNDLAWRNVFNFIHRIWS